MKKREFVLLSFLGRKLIGTAGPRSFFHVESRRGTTPGVDKIPMQEEYEIALEGHDDLDKKIVKLGELN